MSRYCQASSSVGCPTSTPTPALSAQLSYHPPTHSAVLPPPLTRPALPARLPTWPAAMPSPPAICTTAEMADRWVMGKRSPRREKTRGKQPPTLTPVRMRRRKNCQYLVT